MSGINWDAEARTMAEYVLTEMAPCRGVIPWRKAGISVVFGNDPWAEDPPAKEEASKVREALGRVGVTVLGFGVDRLDGLSWALLVEAADAGLLTRLAREAWRRGDADFIPAQVPVARTTDERSGIRPGHPAN